MKKTAYVAALAVMALAASCSQQKGWKVSGNVADAPENAKLAVQAFNGLTWYTIDSVDIAADGNFAFEAAEGSPYPDVYRLGLDGRNIYFPIDSLDAVTVQANGAAFDKGYALDGSDLAREMMSIDASLASYPDSALKSQLNATILADTIGVISYYLVNKTIGGKPLYDLTKRADLSMLGAIANKFDQRMPNDPRTKHLKERFLEARRKNNAGQQVAVLEAPEVGLFDIDLYDCRGQKQSLAALAEAKPVVILSFTSYELDPSLAYNVELNRLLDLYKDRGLAIYQVAFDEDEINWHQAAAPLPWTAVRAQGADANNVLLTYNVDAIPLTYIIKNGSLAERVDEVSNLSKAVASQF